MERRENNIFYNVIKNETSLTEVFCNFMQYKAFRDIFLNIVNDKKSLFDTSLIEYKDFDTEITLDDRNGRSDLHLFTNDSEYIFELKIELYTELTENQPEGYLDYLKSKEVDNIDQNLFFILPRGYLHLKEICDRWLEKTNYPVEKIKNYNIIYWDEILSAIRSSELEKLNIFIDDFCKILDYRWFYFEHIIFTKQELNVMFEQNKNAIEGFKMLNNTTVPQVIKKLFSIVDSTREKLVAVSKYNRQHADFYGYILNNNKYGIPDKWEMWFGVDFEIWEKNNFPITIQLYSDDPKEMDRILKETTFKKFIYEDSEATAYLELEREVLEGEGIAQKLRDKINKEIDKIRT